MNTPNIKTPKIWVNAEFQRLLWLNLSWGMIAGVAIIYALFAFAKDEYRAWHNHLTTIGGMGMNWRHRLNAFCRRRLCVGGTQSEKRYCRQRL